MLEFLGAVAVSLVVDGWLEVQRYVALSLVLTVCCSAEAYQPHFGDRCSLIGFDLEILIIGSGIGRLVDHWPARLAAILFVKVGRFEVLDVLLQISRGDARSTDSAAAGKYPTVG